jgi:S-DNA-T family DNA segregation ATPase FtsK/SpoIIIE
MIEHRLVLRLADRSDYAGAGIPTRLVPDHLPPGRCWSTARTPLMSQVALLVVDPSGPAQTTALEGLAGPPATMTPPRRVEPLPTSVALASLAGSHGTEVVLGLGGDELEPLVVDVAETGFFIAGPPRSGRSTALLTIARQLQSSGCRVLAIAPRASPLRGLAPCHRDREAKYDLESQLADRPDAIVIDDADLLVDSALADLLEKAVRDMRDAGTLVVAAGNTDDLLTVYRGFVTELRRSRVGILLSPQSVADGDLLGVRLSRAVGGPVQPGRGLLCAGGKTLPLQVATTD